MASAAAACARSALRSASARSALRSASATSFRTTVPRVTSQAKAARSPFRLPTQKPLSQPIFRSPVELSCCVESLMPYHTATSSALLTSMLSVSPRSFGWLLEACKDDN